MADLDRKYSISVTPRQADPMWKARQAAEAVTVAVAAYERFAETEPKRRTMRHPPCTFAASAPKWGLKDEPAVYGWCSDTGVVLFWPKERT